MNSSVEQTYKDILKLQQKLQILRANCLHTTAREITSGVLECLDCGHIWHVD